MSERDKDWLEPAKELWLKEGPFKSMEHGLARAMQMTQQQWKNALSVHWLTGIDCVHSAKQDRAGCACGWVSEPMPSVGEAVKAHIEHVSEIVRAALPQAIRKERG